MSGIATLRRTSGERVFAVVNATFMFLFAILCLYPFFYVIILSFNDGRDAMRGGIYFMTRVFTLENYATIFKDQRLLGSFAISVYRTVVGVVLAGVVNTLYAYAVSKSDLPFGRIFTWLVVFPMYFGGGIIPYFLVCKSLGLINNVLVFVLPWAIVPFHVLLLRVAMRTIPASLEESALIDGANYFFVYLRIIVPLSLPALATVSLLAGIMHWNDWLDGTIMVSRSTLWPMQTLLLNILQGADIMALLKGRNLASAGNLAMRVKITPESIKMAMLVVTVVPIFMIYPFAQRYFIRGIMIGSVKE